MNNLMFYCFFIVISSQLLIILLKGWVILLWKDHFTLNIECLGSGELFINNSVTDSLSS